MTILLLQIGECAMGFKTMKLTRLELEPWSGGRSNGRRGQAQPSSFIAQPAFQVFVM